MSMTSTVGNRETVPFQVEWAGAQTEVLRGNVTGHIALGSLSGLSDLYALGPLEGLRGEITLLNSIPYISTVTEAKGIVVGSTFRVGASFLAYVRVGRWVEVTRPPSVRGEVELELFLPEAAAGLGIDPAKPFPYLLEGTLPEARFHILNRTGDAPHNPERHERAKVHFFLKRKAATVIGFYSEGHRGIFTPRGSSIHQHVVTKDRTIAGHVDSIVLGPEVNLFLPDPIPEER